jgi:large subunit ribosomal protein L15e
MIDVRNGTRDYTYKAIISERITDWRRQPAIKVIDKPSRLSRARRLGFKAKNGFIIVRVRVRRGGLHRKEIKGGRRQRHSGLTGFVPAKSAQLIAETRASNQFSNLRVLNSYWVGEDGQYKWFEIIMVDPSNPEIKSDFDINWISENKHKRRVERGLTSSGKAMRGHRKG